MTPSSMRKMSRKAAKANGRRLYFTGKPCRYGHIAPRRTDSGQCVACAREGAAAWRQENREHIAAYNKRYLAKPDHKKKRLEYMRAYMKRKRLSGGKPTRYARGRTSKPVSHDARRD
jgi:hypothetical protein